MLILLQRLLSDMHLSLEASSGVQTAFNLRVFAMIGILFNAISSSGMSISVSSVPVEELLSI